MPPQKIIFVLGGAASGKSTYAESLVTKADERPVYLATAEARDEEMFEKIAKHRARRGEEWRDVACPRDAAGAISGLERGDIALLDCATMWLTNVMLAEGDVAAETQALLSALRTSAAPVVVVSNEVGQGIVPEHRLGRRFREAQGQLNQDLAALADTVVLVVAGLPLALKGTLP